MKFFEKYQLLTSLIMIVVMPAAYAATAQYSPRALVFASDPQYPWTEHSDSGTAQTDSDRDARSKWLIESQYSDIASFRTFNSGASKVPVMINGDITAFGHGWQRSTVKPILDKYLGENYDYGLGNHDYENNVGDCFLNSCAAGSVVDFNNRYVGKLDSLDVKLNNHMSITKSVIGSLAYSRTYGDVHLVQLHNEPTYSTVFTGWDWGMPTTYQITDSLDWLEQDLKAARQKGRIILLNMHKPNDWKGSREQIDRFRQMIQKYQVTAVFAGHYHRDGGAWWGYDQRTYFGGVPVFLSGGASQQTYLTASFSQDRKSLTVRLVKENKWPKQTEVKTIPVL
ncbi:MULTISPECIES: metallophosphoesterase family protein [unclassified Pseudomonas]|uniref:metallophosphoesterase family protein n=1 Tax=unclassified Pseudomonas TaxID=196821 RepID=UPI002AC8C774|nr:MULTISPECIES: metallophosphoesterase [unclassified Pseudomonas]MEB0046252.1 metallophosphoesterase [Pseudomonas sp. Dout3]MEB0097512.1 metallophosphoesterase [Pseudomonas sp. DC1.2]WPX60802.1 metallophosphoesterase [Pseudomonas sp. DC1.2]